MQAAARLGTLCWLLLMAGAASAQMPLEPSGLRGGRHVGSALAGSPAARVAAGVGYAFTEGVLDENDRHHRGMGELGAAYTPRDALQIALTLQTRHDAHHGGGAGDDRGTALSGALTSRHAFALAHWLALGGQARLRLPAADGARRALRALSPELALLATARAPHGLEATLQVGYRFDRSLRGVGDAGRLSPADLLAAELSRSDAVLLGALLALPLGAVVGSLEASWDVMVGGAAPPATASPLRVRLAAQLPFRGRYVAGLELGASPSARPDVASLARVEPRVWTALSFAVLLEQRRPELSRSPAAPPPTHVTPEPPAPALLDLRVVDVTGAAIEGATAAPPEGGSPLAPPTDRDGATTLTLPESQAATVTVTHADFAPRTVELAARPGRQALTVTLTRDLPEGEIKGKVRSLRRGKSLPARITVEPLNITLETDAEGHFVIPVPPGVYTLEIAATGHEPQRRAAKVEHLGVTILVVDLRRLPR